MFTPSLALTDKLCSRKLAKRLKVFNLPGRALQMDAEQLQFADSSLI